MEQFYGNNFKDWIGIVEEVVDQTYVKVRILGIHPLDKSKVSTTDLPLAVVIYPTTGGQTGYGSAQHNLEVDSWVYGTAADELFQNLYVLGTFEGTDYSMSTYNSGGGEFVGDGGYYGNPEVDTSGTTNIPGGSNAEKVYNFIYSNLVREGSSSDIHMHTSAFMGVLKVEVPTFDPAVTGGYKGRAWGICQWLNPRRRQLFERYGRTKRLDQQLDFMWWELNNSPMEMKAKRRWLSSTNIPDATAGASSFERNGCWDLKRGVIIRSHPIFRKTLKFAYQFYNSASYTGGSSNGSTSGGQTLT